jgi:hypothetical protein
MNEQLKENQHWLQAELRFILQYKGITLGTLKNRLFPPISIGLVSKKRHQSCGAAPAGWVLLYALSALYSLSSMKPNFSEKLDRHINSIRFVVTQYNLSLQV